MVENPIKSEWKRDEQGKFVPGGPGGPGRTPQKTLKEFAREWFLQLSNEDKINYLTNLEKVRPGFAWTMSEGNPTEDKNITIKVPTPILGGSSQALTVEANELLEPPQITDVPTTDTAP